MAFTDYSHGVYGMSTGGYVTYQKRENPIHDTEHIKHFEAIAKLKRSAVNLPSGLN